MMHPNFLPSFYILLFSSSIRVAVTAGIQASSQTALYQPSQALSAASVASVATESASQVTPSSLPANGDPCGPAHQDTPDYANTCNLVPALVQSPAPYGINCSETQDVAKYPKVGITWANTEASIDSICVKMEDSRTLTGIWIWSMLATSASLGFFLPPYKGAAARPSKQRCLEIFAAMNNTCATTTIPSDYASINLATLPGFDPSYWNGGANVGKGWPENKPNYLGSAINVGYISYAITANAPAM